MKDVYEVVIVRTQNVCFSLSHFYIVFSTGDNLTDVTVAIRMQPSVTDLHSDEVCDVIYNPVTSHDTISIKCKKAIYGNHVILIRSRRDTFAVCEIEVFSPERKSIAWW